MRLRQNSLAVLAPSTATLIFLVFIYTGGFRVAVISKMERFVIIFNGFHPLTIITKRSILDVATALDPSLICHFFTLVPYMTRAKISWKDIMVVFYYTSLRFFLQNLDRRLASCSQLYTNCLKILLLHSGACNFITKETLAQVIPVTVGEFLRTSFSQNTSRRRVQIHDQILLSHVFSYLFDSFVSNFQLKSLCPVFQVCRKIIFCSFFNI